MATRLGIPVLALSLAIGCSVGPDYQEPAPQTAAVYENGVAEDLSGGNPIEAWWHEFGDPRLDDLVTRALAGNRSVKESMALLRQARALYAQETFALAPTVTAQADYTRQMLSNATFLSGVPRAQRTFGYFDGTFDATWEIDLFGRVRRSVEASSAEVGAQEASLKDVTLTLIAEVARNYFELRGAKIRLDVARKSATVEDETLRFAVARMEGGRGTELDVARARAQLKSTLALIPPIEADAIRAKNRLAVLLGSQPQGFTVDVGSLETAGTLPSIVAIGKPEDLLRRRPDIREAERRLAASTARIGVATADLFPRLTFNGTFGPQAPTVPGLFHAGAASYTYGPSLTWPAFDLGRVAARLRAANALAEADLEHYEQTVLLALEDTENALVEFGRDRVRRDELVEAVGASERAVILADTRYQAGATDYLTTLDAQRTMLSLRLQLASSRTQTITALIALYKSLGGGWEAAQPLTRPD